MLTFSSFSIFSSVSSLLPSSLSSSSSSWWWWLWCRRWWCLRWWCFLWWWWWCLLPWWWRWWCPWWCLLLSWICFSSFSSSFSFCISCWSWASWAVNLSLILNSGSTTSLTGSALSDFCDASEPDEMFLLLCVSSRWPLLLLPGYSCSVKDYFSINDKLSDSESLEYYHSQNQHYWTFYNNN